MTNCDSVHSAGTPVLRTPVRRRITVEGIVQGVGFRPFAAALADRFGIAGFVGNDTTGVFVEAEADPQVLDAFVAALSAEAPPLARVDAITSADLEPVGASGFAIVGSLTAAGRHALVTADAATCGDCLRELADAGDRRFRYPFINCTNCGPRFTIVRGIPYDRERTSMSGFVMCQQCQAEYDDPADRRFHAEPVCCPACGPTLAARDSAGTAIDSDPVEVAASALREGKIVAVKGLGGYHLAVAANDERAVARLRGRKHREERPFALMVSDIAAAAALCVVDDCAERVLTGPGHPIVLLPRRPGAAVAVAVAPHTRELGLMLPYTPLHHLLLAAVGRPIVLTSGNRSDEPIAFDDTDAAARLADIADVFVSHDRPIETRVDDSVIRTVHGAPMLIRRSRGFAPMPIRLPVSIERPVLACGAQLKNTFCLGRGQHAFVSHHIGDLENFETLTAFSDGIDHLAALLSITPAVVAYDLHPDYLSTQYALELEGVDQIGVQHHHAHIASCLADNATTGPVIGVAFDGTGFGTDNTVWGGEFLVADLATAQRVARLQPVPLPGASAAIREPWRMAASYLDTAWAGQQAPELDVTRRHAAHWDAVRSAARAGVNAPLTSSAGRLFDAIAAILDVRDEVSYEGQAAVELEQLASPDENGGYAVSAHDVDGLLTIRSTELVRSVVADRLAGVPPAVIAARFHNAMAAVIAATCRRIRELHGLSVVALSGGVFQNRRLVESCLAELDAAGFVVLTHRQVPPNDGGISLGQAVVAAARSG